MKNRVSIVFLMFFIIISNVGCASVPISEGMTFSKSFDQSISFDVDDAEKLSVNVAIGQCKISHDDSKDATIYVDYDIKSNKKEFVDEIVSHVDLKVESNDGLLTVELLEVSSGDMIWDWIYTKYGNAVELTADLDIILPTSINDFRVEVGVGDIHLDGLIGEYNIASGVGDILLNNLSIIGDSDFTTGVGDIKLKSNTACGTITANSSVGDVELSLDECTFDCSSYVIGVGTGNIVVYPGMNSCSIVSEDNGYTSCKKNIKIADSCEVKMNTDIGKITIR